MKIKEYIASNLGSYICFIGGVVMAVMGIHGWGWLLFVGIIVTS